MLQTLARWYKLRRHRIGIGVHSPFAYRVVRDVIYGKGRYYADGSFERLTQGLPRRLKREYALMFRFIARLAPDGVRVADSVEPQIEPLVRLADKRPLMARGLGGYLRGKRILTICEAADLRRIMPEGLLRSGNMAIVRHLNSCPGVLDALRRAVKGGWLFADKKTAIAVCDEHEPLNVIDVKII